MPSVIKPHPEVVHLQYVCGGRRSGDAGDMREHVPTRADLSQELLDAGDIAQVAFAVLRRGRLVGSHVHREHIFTAVVEVRGGRRTDA
jgi:hypothetical protein